MKSHSTADTDGQKTVNFSNKYGVQEMSAEATTIHAMRSFTIVTTASYTSNFRWPQNKKSEGLSSGKHRGRQLIHCVQSTSLNR
ncbi:hypothetical protein TNCV_1582081 [Trichonephila clavipes]|nr:hypothetical protein TNCV_1582081 [Trichonephila clavipes]